MSEYVGYGDVSQECKERLHYILIQYILKQWIALLACADWLLKRDILFTSEKIAMKTVIIDKNK